MLKRMFALSDQGSRDLNKGIAATTLSNLCLIAPVSLLVMVIWELLNVISGQESSMRDHAALFICGTVVMFIIQDTEYYQCITKLASIYLDYYLRDRSNHLSYLRRARGISTTLSKNWEYLGKARSHAGQLRTRLQGFGPY